MAETIKVKLLMRKPMYFMMPKKATPTTAPKATKTGFKSSRTEEMRLPSEEKADFTCSHADVRLLLSTPMMLSTSLTLRPLW